MKAYSTILILLLFASYTNAQIDDSQVSDDMIVMEAVGCWSPRPENSPCEPAVKYWLQYSINGTAWVTLSDTLTDSTYTMYLDYYGNHRIRVAGITADNRVGAFSLPSKTYTPADSTHEHPSFCTQTNLGVNNQ